MKGGVRGGGRGLFTYPESSSSSKLIQAECGSPLFDSLPFLSGCTRGKRKNNSHVLLSSVAWAPFQVEPTHILEVIRKMWSGHLSGRCPAKNKTEQNKSKKKRKENSRLLLADAELLHRTTSRDLKDISTTSVEQSHLTDNCQDEDVVYDAALQGTKQLPTNWKHIESACFSILSMLPNHLRYHHIWFFCGTMRNHRKCQLNSYILYLWRLWCVWAWGFL